MIEFLIILAIPLLTSFLMTMVLAQKMTIISYNGYATLRPKGEVSKGMEMGGLSLFPIILISLCFTLALPYTLGIMDFRHQIEPAIMRVLQVIMGCSILYLMGIKDDFHGTSSKTKFLTIFLAAAMFPVTGLWINNLHGLFGICSISPWIGMPLSLLLAILIILLPSITDSPDGIATGKCTLIAVLYLLLSVYCQHALSIIIATATIGVTLPFSLLKRFSRKWRKTLMGSSGNYIFGYILCYLTLGVTRQCGSRLPDEAVMLCFGIAIIPVVDTIRVLINRITEKRDLLKPDKNQMQHLLIRTGIQKRFVSWVIMFIMLFFTGLNMLCIYYRITLTVIFFIDIVALAVLSFTVNKLINYNETLHAYKKWNKEYGREAWEANIPTEKLNRKIERFGTMGLPSGMILSNAEEFIPDGMSGFERAIKRLVDLIASTVCLVVFSPLFLVCYLLIKIDDGGPAIFKQERIGRFGRPFCLYKFRSMRTDAEKHGPALSHAGGDDDPRLTKVGRFLRAHHLDELPQLWNVFKGDMAFIGYRPERKFYIDQIMEHDPRYVFLYQIRPGVTSYATLHYGYTDTLEKMLRRTELDLHYLKNRSWWFDVKILFLTFTNIVSGKKF